MWSWTHEAAWLLTFPASGLHITEFLSTVSLECFQPVEDGSVGSPS